MRELLASSLETTELTPKGFRDVESFRNPAKHGETRSTCTLFSDMPPRIDN
jgi:hypothetical protein